MKCTLLKIVYRLVFKVSYFKSKRFSVTQKNMKVNFIKYLVLGGLLSFTAVKKSKTS